jgi:hypothetical protein
MVSLYFLANGRASRLAQPRIIDVLTLVSEPSFPFFPRLTSSRLCLALAEYYRPCCCALVLCGVGVDTDGVAFPGNVNKCFELDREFSDTPAVYAFCGPKPRPSDVYWLVVLIFFFLFFLDTPVLRIGRFSLAILFRGFSSVD